MVMPQEVPIDQYFVPTGTWESGAYEMPELLETLTPQEQYQSRVLERLSGLGVGPSFTEPYQRLQQAAMQGYAPSFGQYLLSSPLDDLEAQAAGGYQPFYQYLESPTSGVDPLERWGQLVSASRAIPTMTPEQELALTQSGFNQFLGGPMSRVLARTALGGPTRGFLGRLMSGREQGMRNLFEQQQLRDPRIADEQYLGWLAGRLPQGAFGGYAVPEGTEAAYEGMSMFQPTYGGTTGSTGGVGQGIQNVVNDYGGTELEKTAEEALGKQTGTGPWSEEYVDNLPKPYLDQVTVDNLLAENARQAGWTLVSSAGPSGTERYYIDASGNRVDDTGFTDWA